MSEVLIAKGPNNYSEELKALIPEFKSGKKYIFKQLAAYYDPKKKKKVVPNSRRLINHDVIFDKVKDENIDIMCIDRKVINGKGHNGSDIKLREVIFERSFNGEWVLDGATKKDKPLFEYLWFSNFNRSNRGKDFHLPPKGSYVYEFVENEKKAEALRPLLALQAEFGTEAVNAVSAGSVEAEAAPVLQLIDAPDEAAADK